ncbi:PAS domain-containing sensor histidine kinase [Fodinibius sediminis]|uniref:PAS domain S-box-containing protein n=1 Tax=Fodinibius sediminis TaxID=1214077 RepID=A0A521FAQ7_9BACT|nr:PAS domain S-box protein [Fodinibius sediminis]SMO93282.1 PAS domain S-box-containing protein [Fodinibius sediminis]
MKIRNFDQFFHDNPIPMWVYDPEDYSIREVNQAMADTYGYSREEMLSFTLFDLRPEEEVPRFKQYLSQLDNESVGDEGVWKHQKKNGEFVYARVVRNPVRFDNEEHDYQLVMYKDLTSEMNTQLSNDMLFKHSLDGIMLTNPNGKILQANQAACDILGMSEQEIIERGRDGIVAKDKKLEKALEQRSQTGKFAGELNYIHKSGRKIPVELTSSVFVNYAGEKRTSLIFRDISDRKEQQQALREEKEFTEAVLNSLPGIFYVLNHQGRVMRINDHAEEVFGLPADKFIGRSAAEFVHKSDREKVPEEIRGVLDEGYRVFELTLRTGGGNTEIYRFNAERLDQGGQTYIIGTGIEITKKKELEEQLNSLLQEEHAQRKKAEADRDKLKEMFEEAPTPKCLLEGPDLRFVIANKAYREVVGQEDIIGKKVIDVIPEVEAQGYIDLLDQVYDEGETYLGHAEHIYFDKDKEEAQKEYIFNFIYEPLFDNGGEVYGIFVEAMDYSKQIAYQEELEKSLTEKETLLAEIHHRVKNNLAIITGMMQLQAMETEDIELQGALRSAQQRIQTIATIHELLYGSKSLSHVNFGENVKQLLHNLEGIYDTGKHITVDLHVEDILMNINQAIPCALMINEVVTNAYKHAFNHQQEGEIAIQLCEKDGNVVVKIIDNGEGLPDHIMQEGSSTIGMTLINLLKQQLEGEVQFLNDNGTRFQLSFEKANLKGSGSSLIKN